VVLVTDFVTVEECWGPFASVESATTWADQRLPGLVYRVFEMRPPTSLPEDQPEEWPTFIEVED
jgi:hypothetical protein